MPRGDSRARACPIAMSIDRPYPKCHMFVTTTTTTTVATTTTTPLNRCLPAKCFPILSRRTQPCILEMCDDDIGDDTRARNHYSNTLLCCVFCVCVYGGMGVFVRISRVCACDTHVDTTTIVCSWGRAQV